MPFNNQAKSRMRETRERMGLLDPNVVVPDDDLTAINKMMTDYYRRYNERYNEVTHTRISKAKVATALSSDDITRDTDLRAVALIEYKETNPIELKVQEDLKKIAPAMGEIERRVTKTKQRVTYTITIILVGLATTVSYMGLHSAHKETEAYNKSEWARIAKANHRDKVAFDQRRAAERRYLSTVKKGHETLLDKAILKRYQDGTP